MKTTLTKLKIMNINNIKEAKKLADKITDYGICLNALKKDEEYMPEVRLYSSTSWKSFSNLLSPQIMNVIKHLIISDLEAQIHAMEQEIEAL